MSVLPRVCSNAGKLTNSTIEVVVVHWFVRAQWFPKPTQGFLERSKNLEVNVGQPGDTFLLVY